MNKRPSKPSPSHRKVLERLREHADRVPSSEGWVSLPVQAKPWNYPYAGRNLTPAPTLALLERNGWIEVNGARNTARITDAGRSALAATEAPKA